MELIRGAVVEIAPKIKLSKADLVILHSARGICKQARELTTESIDDESVWSNAYLALDEALQSYEAQA